MSKQLFFGCLFLTCTCLCAGSVEKKFSELKNNSSKEITDIVITDDASADFFSGKTLKNITFNGKVTGDWKNVKFAGTIIFSTLPTGSVDKEIAGTFALADGASVQVAKVGDQYKWQKG